MQKRKSGFPFSSSFAKVPRLSVVNEGKASSSLHRAASRNQVAMIDRPLATGCKLFTRNSMGHTPLVSAIMFNKYKAVLNLLSLDDTYVSKPSHHDPTAVYDFSEPSGITEPKQCDLCTIEKEVDSAENFTIDESFLTDDAEALGQALDRATSISSRQSVLLVEHALKLGYPEEAMLALLKRGPGSVDRRAAFFSRVTEDLDDAKTRPYFDRLIEWQVIDRGMLSPSIWSLRCERRDLFEALLDLGVVQYARSKFGVELLASHFRWNDHNTAEEWRVLQFDVNGLDLLGFGALHWACLRQTNGISYLLDNGADPNLRGRRGRTPLFYAVDDEAVQLLLDAGADVQIRDDNGYSLLEGEYAEYSSKYVAAHVGVLAEKGLLHVQPSGTYECIVLSCQQDFKKMKTVRVVGCEISLYSVLLDSADETAQYIKDRETVAKIMKTISDCWFIQKSYKKMLAQKLKDALEVHELRSIAANFLSRTMTISDCKHLVIEQIVKYLNYKDLLAVRKIERQISNNIL